MFKFVEIYYAYMEKIDPAIYVILGCIVFGITAYIAFHNVEDSFDDLFPKYVVSGMIGMLAVLVGGLIVMLFPLAAFASIIILTTIAAAQFVHHLIKPRT